MSEELIAILADYFCGPDLVLCSIAMAPGDPETTARKRAVRFFQVRDAFNIPRDCDMSAQAAFFIRDTLWRGARAAGV